MKDNKLAFTFASAEVSKIGQQFIKITELLTGKLILKKLYDQYLLENNPPENFWNDALKKLKLSVVSHYHSEIGIPSLRYFNDEVKKYCYMWKEGGQFSTEKYSPDSELEK